MLQLPLRRSLVYIHYSPNLRDLLGGRYEIWSSYPAKLGQLRVASQGKLLSKKASREPEETNSLEVGRAGIDLTMLCRLVHVVIPMFVQW